MKVAVYRPALRLEDLAAYRKLRVAANMQRVAYEKLMAQVKTILDRIAGDSCEDELKQIERLHREIRLITKGTPLTEALAPQDRDPVLVSEPGFNQRQYNARTVLLRAAYRKLAALCHPDREGGDHDAFQEVKTAYDMRDLERLNAIYFSIVEGRNLYWQQDAGLYHVGTEYERYHVKIETMKQTAGWRAARLYLAGAVNSAVNVVKQDLHEQIMALHNEIHYLNIKGKQNGEERKGNPELEEAGQESGQGCESRQDQEIQGS